MSLSRVELSLQADEDIFEAALYYAEVTESLLVRFYKSLAAAQQHIARYPSSGLSRYAHELANPNLRYWPLTDFPYALFYLELTDVCRVIRCAHMASDIPASLSEPQVALH